MATNPTVRFAETDQQHRHRHQQQQQPHPECRAGAAVVLLRLPNISASPAGSSVDGPLGGLGCSPPRSPQDPSSCWKYPLPSKSFRLYVGPPLRQSQTAATSQHGGSGGSVSPDRLQRSRTEPAITGHRGPPQAAPFLPSRALISLRRRQPQQLHQLQQQLHREATAAPYDEAERLRWTMTSQRHWQADRKGQQGNQGPFSREFTVHVTAPSNWLHMKWGRRQPHQSHHVPPADDQLGSYRFTKQAFGQEPRG